MVSMAWSKAMQFFAASLQLKQENIPEAFNNRDLENLAHYIIRYDFSQVCMTGVPPQIHRMGGSRLLVRRQRAPQGCRHKSSQAKRRRSPGEHQPSIPFRFYSYKKDQDFLLSCDAHHIQT
jgi:hypothetical protein